MNHGKFFSLDLEASHLDKGIAVFDYTDIFDASIDDSESQTTPRYPIFVSISSASVKFILQYCVYKQQDDSFKIMPKSDKLTKGGKLKTSSEVRHLEEVLIELPLTVTSGYSLAATLKRLYLTPFPIQLKKEKNYILELIERRYENVNIKVLPFSHQKPYKSKKELDLSPSNITYSSLPVYNLLKENNVLKENNGYELYTLHTIKDKKTNEKKYEKVLQKLGLDFFLKMLHRDAKEKKYDKVLQKIVLDFFFDMMHSDVFKNSAHYDQMYSAFMSDFFCSAIIRKAEFYYQRELVNSLPNDVDAETISIYAEKLDIAEKHWVECIQSPLSDKHFEFQPKWYDPEPQKASLLDRIKNLKKTFSKSYPFTLVDYWFATPEEEMQRVYYPKNKDEKSCSYDLYKYANARKAKSTIKDKETTTEKTTNNENIMSMNRDSVLKRATEVSKWCLKRYDFREAYRISWFYGANSLMLCFLSAIIISVVILESYKTAFCLLAAYVLVMIECAIYFSIKDKSAIRIVNNVYFFYPRLIAAITAAWLTIALGEDLYKAFFDIDLNGWSLSIIVLFIWAFVTYEVHRIVPRIKPLSKILRAGELMIISFAISLAVGICVINFTGDRMLVRSGILPKMYRDDVLVNTTTHNNGDPTLMLNFGKISADSAIWTDSIVMNYYTHSPYSHLDSTGASLAVRQFADTPYDNTYMQRIANIYLGKDSLITNNTPTDLADSISLVRGRFLLNHDNSLLFKDLLPYVEHRDDNHPVAKIVPLGNYKLFLLHDFLIQFAVIAMFIGIFIQMIFEEKNVTES